MDSDNSVRGEQATPTGCTVLGVFASIENARHAYDELLSAGFSRNDVDIIANEAGCTDNYDVPCGDSGSEVATDAGIGAALGGVGGLLAGLAVLPLPGIGPVLAAGPIIAALGGVGVGAAAGGLIGALTERGVPEMVAGHYAEGVRRGNAVVGVRAIAEQVARVSEIFGRNSALDIDRCVDEWRGRGWTAYDAGAPPLSRDELRREREYFEAAKRQADELGRTKVG